MFHFDRDFKDRNGERRMLPERIQALLRDLKKHVFTYREPIGNVEACEGEKPREDGWRPYDCKKDTWGGYDVNILFPHKFSVPKELSGKKIWYSVEVDDVADYWQWAAPQKNLYIGGKCMAGMDSNHRDVELTDSAEAGKTYDVLVSAYTDPLCFERPLRFRPYLTAVDTDALSLYYDLKVAYDTAHKLDTDDLGRIDLIRYVNEAFNILNMNGTEKEFRNTLVKAAEYIRATAYSGHKGGGKPVVAAVGSTHIDVAWFWRFTQTREKARRSFSTAVHLIEKNPEYIFMSSQPQLYAFVKEDEPELFEKIKHWVKLGRWEVEGAMWVEADTNLLCGEPFARQFLFGKRFISDEFGKDSRVLWLPDVFGYSGALPQLMKQSGVDYFMTTKMSWNEFDKLPYDTFRWRGIDGTDVLTHFMPTMDKDEADTEWKTTYNGLLNPSHVMGAWERYQQKDLNREVLSAFGHGDGGGTTQEMLGYGKRISMGLPSCPDLKFSRVLSFFERLEKSLRGKKNVPCWDGELYFEFHRGTYTSESKIKRWNRKNEIRCIDAENVCVLRGLLPGDMKKTYPRDVLDQSWRLLLLNQFHDVLPGSSIAAVYEDAYKYHGQIRDMTEKAAGDALDAIAARIGAKGLTVFNTLSFDRSAPVIFRRDDGEKLLPAVKNADGRLHLPRRKRTRQGL